ncbi:hypothetical protein EW145_g3619 [Phellinidium pouzarii]|uniref:Uncharacterized protein n=1 Tax=Phellinidium pouzarii TaxID=167371 RepID=A0A4S4LBP3_9AGAM|nr:hypothetical protein EW145_g3619 [Phellinidium pouzarii]
MAGMSTFDGQGDVRTWIRTFNCQFLVKETPENERVQIAMDHLSQTVQGCIDSITIHLENNELEPWIWTWPSLKVALEGIQEQVKNNGIFTEELFKKAATVVSFAGIACVAGPALLVGGLNILGFSAVGPVAGTAAAAIQSVFYGGAVQAGSAFALCQSAAMGGAALTTATVGSAVGGAAIGTVHGIAERRPSKTWEDGANFKPCIKLLLALREDSSLFFPQKNAPPPLTRNNKLSNMLLSLFFIKAVIALCTFFVADHSLYGPQRLNALKAAYLSPVADTLRISYDAVVDVTQRYLQISASPSPVKVYYLGGPPTKVLHPTPERSLLYHTRRTFPPNADLNHIHNSIPPVFAGSVVIVCAIVGLCLHRKSRRVKMASAPLLPLISAHGSAPLFVSAVAFGMEMQNIAVASDSGHTDYQLHLRQWDWQFSNPQNASGAGIVQEIEAGDVAFEVNTENDSPLTDTGDILSDLINFDLKMVAKSETEYGGNEGLVELTNKSERTLVTSTAFAETSTTTTAATFSEEQPSSTNVEPSRFTSCDAPSIARAVERPSQDIHVERNLPRAKVKLKALQTESCRTSSHASKCIKIEDYGSLVASRSLSMVSPSEATARLTRSSTPAFSNLRSKAALERAFKPAKMFLMELDMRTPARPLAGIESDGDLEMDKFDTGLLVSPPGFYQPLADLTDLTFGPSFETPTSKSILTPNPITPALRSSPVQSAFTSFALVHSAESPLHSPHGIALALDEPGPNEAVDIREEKGIAPIEAEESVSTSETTLSPADVSSTFWPTEALIDSTLSGLYMVSDDLARVQKGTDALEDSLDEIQDALNSVMAMDFEASRTYVDTCTSTVGLAYLDKSVGCQDGPAVEKAASLSFITEIEGASEGDAVMYVNSSTSTSALGLYLIDDSHTYVDASTSMPQIQPSPKYVNASTSIPQIQHSPKKAYVGASIAMSPRIQHSPKSTYTDVATSMSPRIQYSPKNIYVNASTSMPQIQRSPKKTYVEASIAMSPRIQNSPKNTYANSSTSMSPRIENLSMKTKDYLDASTSISAFSECLRVETQTYLNASTSTPVIVEKIFLDASVSALGLVLDEENTNATTDFTRAFGEASTSTSSLRQDEEDGEARLKSYIDAATSTSILATEFLDETSDIRLHSEASTSPPSPSEHGKSSDNLVSVSTTEEDRAVYSTLLASISKEVLLVSGSSVGSLRLLASDSTDADAEGGHTEVMSEEPTPSLAVDNDPCPSYLDSERWKATEDASTPDPIVDESCFPSAHNANRTPPAPSTTSVSRKSVGPRISDLIARFQQPTATSTSMPRVIPSPPRTRTQSAPMRPQENPLLDLPPPVPQDPGPSQTHVHHHGGTVASLLARFQNPSLLAGQATQPDASDPTFVPRTGCIVKVNGEVRRIRMRTEFSEDVAEDRADGRTAKERLPKEMLDLLERQKNKTSNYLQ